MNKHLKEKPSGAFFMPFCSTFRRVLEKKRESWRPTEKVGDDSFYIHRPVNQALYFCSVK